MHEFYHRGVVIVLMLCHDADMETKESEMNDHNSMKADEYAQRQGEMDELDDAVHVELTKVISGVPEWIDKLWTQEHENEAIEEAKRRVMKAIKERNEL
jgi:hypothetical protein